jgi:hypothetical protein
MEDEIDVRHLPDWFWDTIAQAGGDARKLLEILKPMKNSQLREFDRLFMAAGEALWWEPYDNYMGFGNPELSEDDMKDQANMAVSQGKEYYLKVLDHPEVLADMGDDWPDFAAGANYVFVERYGYGILEEEYYGFKEDEVDR